MTPEQFFNEIVIDFLEKNSFILEEMDSDDFYPDDFEEEDEFILESGATKMVFIPRDESCDFVIKIPFVYCEEEVMQGACFSTSGWDYCEQESYIYNKATEESLNLFFLETKRICDYCGHPVYSQTKGIVGARNLVSSNESKKKAEIFLDSWQRSYTLPYNQEWIASALEQYGEKEVLRLNEFLCEIDSNDLHVGNIGMDSLGRPVLIDYSGFDY